MAGQEMEGLMGAGAQAVPEAGMAPAAQGDTPMLDQAGSQQTGQIDIQPMLDGIEVPSELKPMYDKIVLAGMRIMFSKGSHQLLVDQLQKEGPLAEKISAGIVALMYMLWTQSNKSIAPQLIIPAATALTLRAFDYVQKTGDPEATKEVLGQSVEGALDGIMKGFGGNIDSMEQNLQQTAQGVKGAVEQMPQGQAQPMAQPGGGLMDAMGGQNG